MANIVINEGIKELGKFEGINQHYIDKLNICQLKFSEGVLTLSFSELKKIVKHFEAIDIIETEGNENGKEKGQ
jgi:hypothetical protein